MSRTLLRRSAAATLIAAALAVFGPAALASAAGRAADTPVHVTDAAGFAAFTGPGLGADIRTADAASPAALYVGVRQAAVGEEFPVAVVGAAAGSVWEVHVAGGPDAAGSLTIGADGTGTAVVRVPSGTAGGPVEVTAVSGGESLSTTLSVAGDPATVADAPAAPAAAETPAPAADLPVGALVAGGAGILLLAGAAAAVPLAIRRRRERAAA
ncbi:hypothetical protein G5T42_12510 [Microbacterium sp. 4R-513]|uniref:hypothetical protein n=1 Tax=Microbacterium sp. 4R-513 TaxID=2567934 RepID=UPI0013E111C9|nr:hypothetical protein [Microbacterium sp. 4R-513]QIG40203.1 hypothetical protein G5T42_12510 [Microbacterium sp. 4R-513]